MEGNQGVYQCETLVGTETWVWLAAKLASQMVGVGLVNDGLVMIVTRLEIPK